MNRSITLLVLLTATLVLSFPKDVKNKKRNGDYGPEIHNGDDHEEHDLGGHPEEVEYKINDPVEYKELTCSQFAEAYNAIDGFISDPTFAAFAIQATVRLSFHDCVGKSCDGCLNPKDTLNNGVGFRSTSLDIIYDKSFRHILSRADFYALAGHVALIRGVYNTKRGKDKYCPSLFLDYKWGRKDCPTSPNTTDIDGLPNAHGDLGEVLRVLNGMFGLNLVGVVALMGGHSLGAAHTQFSGFNFSWQEDQTAFDNQYYINMITNGFIHTNVGNHSIPSQRYEFVHPFHPEPFMMLNVDMALWKHITAITDHRGEFTGHLTCLTEHGLSVVQEGAPNFVSGCDQAISGAIVLAYANNLQLFYNDFGAAWAQMVSNGYPWDGPYALRSPGENGEVCGSCVPPGAFCAPGYSLSGACCEGYKCIYNVCG